MVSDDLVPESLAKKLTQIKRAGMHPVVKPAPKDAVTFDRMVIVYLDEQQKRLYQVHFYDTRTDKVLGTF